MGSCHPLSFSSFHEDRTGTNSKILHGHQDRHNVPLSRHIMGCSAVHGGPSIAQLGKLPKHLSLTPGLE